MIKLIIQLVILKIILLWNRKPNSFFPSGTACTFVVILNNNLIMT